LTAVRNVSPVNQSINQINQPKK